MKIVKKQQLIVLVMCLSLLLWKCSSPDVELEESTNLETEIIIQNAENGPVVQGISIKEFNILVEEHSESNRNALNNRNCAQTHFVIHWLGHARLTPFTDSTIVLQSREQIRQEFMDNYGLDAALHQVPEVNHEVWIFNAGEEGTLCLGEEVRGAVNMHPNTTTNDPNED